jgi:hypothetical protein
MNCGEFYFLYICTDLVCIYGCTEKISGSVDYYLAICGIIGVENNVLQVTGVLSGGRGILNEL